MLLQFLIIFKNNDFLVCGLLGLFVVVFGVRGLVLVVCFGACFGVVFVMCLCGVCGALYGALWAFCGVGGMFAWAYCLGRLWGI